MVKYIADENFKLYGKIGKIYTNKGLELIEEPIFLSSFFWSGLQGPKAYSLWGGVVPSPSIG